MYYINQKHLAEFGIPSTHLKDTSILITVTNPMEARRYLPIATARPLKVGTQEHSHTEQKSRNEEIPWSSKR